MLNIWVEKFRPKKLNDMILNDSYRNKFQQMIDNKRLSGHLLLYGRAGIGKCITEDSLLLTKDGFLYINEFSENVNGFIDKYIDIFGYDGFNKTNKFYEEFTGETIHIRTKFGFEIEGTLEHPILVMDNSCNLIFKELKDISKNDVICISYNTNIFGKPQEIIYNYKRKDKDFCSKSFNPPKKLTLEFSRLLGYIIANGSSLGNGIQLSTKNKKIYNDIKNICHSLDIYISEQKNDKNFRIGHIQFFNFIKFLLGGDIKTARYKQIPKIILTSSKENQIEFVKALFDCDSYISNQNTLEYYTASSKLSIEIQLLLFNFGIFCYRKSHYNIKYNHYYHTIYISSSDFNNYVNLVKSSLKYEFKFNKKCNTNIKKMFYLEDYFKKNIKKLKMVLNVNKGGWIKNKNCIVKRFPNELNIYKTDLDYLINKLNVYMYVDYDNILFSLKYKLLQFKNLIFDKVDILEKNNTTKKVYDFHIPEKHNFYSNGFISHNTTLAKILTNEITNSSLFVNSSDERGIDTVRNKMKSFACMQTIIPDEQKIIICDEIDNMSSDGFLALRGILEAYTKTTTFVATCNYIHKIPEPILSRFQTIEFFPVNKEEAIEYIKEKILKKENINFDDNTLNKLYMNNDGDLRKMINSLQSCILNGKLVVDNSDIMIEFKDVWMSKDINKLKKFLSERTIDYNSFYKFIYQRVKNSVHLLIISEYQYRHAISIDKEINFAACICKLWSVMK